MVARALIGSWDVQVVSLWCWVDGGVLIGNF